MPQQRTAIATLEQACSQLETVLRKEVHWRSLGKATLPANRAAHERALAGNPVFHAWRLVNRAIGEIEAAAGHSAGQEASGPAQPPPEAEATTRPRRSKGGRGGLARVLERVGETPFDTDAPSPPAVAAKADAPSEAPPHGPGKPATDIEIEEASVSFIVREPVASAPQPVSAGTPAAEGCGHAAEAPSDVVPADAATDPGREDDGETEVTIVVRRG